MVMYFVFNLLGAMHALALRNLILFELVCPNHVMCQILRQSILPKMSKWEKNTRNKQNSYTLYIIRKVRMAAFRKYYFWPVYIIVLQLRRNEINLTPFLRYSFAILDNFLYFEENIEIVYIFETTNILYQTSRLQ